MLAERLHTMFRAHGPRIIFAETFLIDWSQGFGDPCSCVGEDPVADCN